MTDGQRITKLKEYLGISANAMANEIGLKNPQIFYDIKAGKCGISKDLASKIQEHYLNISSAWLLTGEGEMLINSGNETAEMKYGKLIPFYDAEVAASTSLELDSSPAYPTQMIEIGTLLREAEAAIRVYGNSMIPNYPAGCVVGTRLHSDSFIEPGTVYVIETRGGRYIKRLYYNEDHSAYACHSDNTMIYDDGARKGTPFYPDFEIPICEVIRLHRVIGVIKRNTL